MVVVLGTKAIGQNTIFYYNFDDCTFEDATTGFPGLTPAGDLDCVCGLNSQSFYMNGDTDYLTVSAQANVALSKDFTLDFYFTLDDPSGEIDIMSHRNGCTGIDSIMSLKYFSDTNELLFELASNVNNYHSVRTFLDEGNCWHRFTLTKFNLVYLLYIDDVLVKSILTNEDVIFSKNANLSFANNPCNNATRKRFKGQIDEISLYDRALSELEIKERYLYPDKIITQNTTIFKGESITILTGSSCANTVVWNPTTTLDDATSLTPKATPAVSTTYTLSLDNGGCSSTDSVRIFVADRALLDCDKLLLPNAFTPNNDGLNDKFGISNIFLVDELRFFEVYDRWGAKIWETTTLGEGWDGSFNGQPAMGGMYLFKIKYTCNQQEKLNVNNFTLIR